MPPRKALDISVVPGILTGAAALLALSSCVVREVRTCPGPYPECGDQQLAGTEPARFDGRRSAGIPIGAPGQTEASTYPPEPLSEEVPALDDGQIWVDGYWHWNGTEWVWMSGSAQQAPEGDYVYVEPSYEVDDDHCVYTPGYWQSYDALPATVVVVRDRYRPPRIRHPYRPYRPRERVRDRRGQRDARSVARRPGRPFVRDRRHDDERRPGRPKVRDRRDRLPPEPLDRGPAVVDRQGSLVDRAPTPARPTPPPRTRRPPIRSAAPITARPMRPARPARPMPPSVTSPDRPTMRAERARPIRPTAPPPRAVRPTRTMPPRHRGPAHTPPPRSATPRSRTPRAATPRSRTPRAATPRSRAAAHPAKPAARARPARRGRR